MKNYVCFSLLFLLLASTGLVRAQYYIEYSIHTMNGDKAFRMESDDGFNASIIDSGEGELEVQIVDEDDDQRIIQLKIKGSLSIGEKEILEANYFTDDFKNTYKHHSNTRFIIDQIEGETITGKIEGFCYDTKVSHNYKMKVSGKFRLMILQ